MGLDNFLVMCYTKYVYYNIHILLLLFVIVISIWWSPFVPSRNLDEVSLIIIYGSNVPSKPLSY